MFKTNDYLNPTINSSIIEYDIKSGNTSMMKYFKLRPMAEIEHLSSLPKKERVVAIGKIMRSDPEFSKELEKSFNKIVKLFIDENHLVEDDIVSIKRDAVYVKAKDVHKTTFGDCVTFVPKNSYIGFIKIKNFEFWIKDMGSLDIKGMDDATAALHKNGISNLILWVYQLCAQSGMNKNKINSEFANMVNAYKNKELDFAYYREFTGDSKFRVNMLGREMLMEDVSEQFIDKCDISYNFLNIIVPLIRMFC